MKNYKCQHWVCINANETNTAGRAEATWDMLTWYKQYLFLQFSLMKLHLCVLSGWNLGLQLLQVVQKNTITIATTMHIMAFTDFCYNKQVKSTAISQFIGRILQRTWPLRSSWAEFGQLLSCRCDVIGLQMRPQKDAAYELGPKLFWNGGVASSSSFSKLQILKQLIWSWD